jgi:pyruvate dehydrogenase E1 component alpha subunit
MAVFGDGAMNQGAVHEAMNFAAMASLPVLFLCENNQWSELTPTREMVRNPRLTDRATALGIPAISIDGNSPAAVRETAADLAEAAREGGGPAFVELMTQRLAGHYIGDVQQYRSRDELEAAQRAEPIARAVQELTEAGVPAADLSEIEAFVRDEVEQAAAAALADPAADTDRVREHVYG